MVEALRVGPGFDVPRTFVRRSGVLALTGSVREPGTGFGSVDSWSVTVSGRQHLAARAWESVELEVGLGLGTFRHGGLEARILGRQERLEVPLPLGGGREIPEGQYRFAQGVVRYRPVDGALTRPALVAEGGTYFGGPSLTLGAEPTWKAAEWLTLWGAYRFSLAALPEKRGTLVAHAVGLAAKAVAESGVTLAVGGRYEPLGSSLRVQVHAGWVSTRSTARTSPR